MALTEISNRTVATYEPDMAINILDKKVVRADRGQSGLVTFMKVVASLFFASCSLISLLFFGPFALLGLIGSFFLFSKRTPKPQWIGLWHGNCPRCSGEMWIHAPPLAEDYPFGCQNCTRQVVLAEKHFNVPPS